MTTKHPTHTWQQASQSLDLDQQLRLRLAAMVGHMQQDKVAARRAAVADLLSDGTVYDREAIWQHINELFSEDVWGKRPAETLQRDIQTLRNGGIRIGYSRRKGLQGYYLMYPAIERPSPSYQEPINWQYIEGLKTLSPAEKTARAFAAADFALKQRALILKDKHPDWSDEKALKEARTIVYGALHE